MAAIDKLLYQYTKKDGHADLRNTSNAPKDKEAAPPASQSGASPVPMDYRKESGTLPSLLVLVISGGEVRERDFLSELAKKHTFPRIRLIFESSEKGKGGLSPKMMLSKLEERIEFRNPNKTHKILYTSIDRIFMLSDVDHYYAELVDILKKDHEPKICWIISNPCFEIWLYYAHFSQITQELRVLETIPQFQQSSTLKQLNNQLVVGGIDPRKAFNNIQLAAKHAKDNYHTDTNGIPQLYSTNMYVFAEYLLAAIGENTFTQWLTEKEQKAEAFKRKAFQ